MRPLPLSELRRVLGRRLQLPEYFEVSDLLTKVGARPEELLVLLDDTGNTVLRFHTKSFVAADAGEAYARFLEWIYERLVDAN